MPIRNEVNNTPRFILTPSQKKVLIGLYRNAATCTGCEADADLTRVWTEVLSGEARSAKCLVSLGLIQMRNDCEASLTQTGLDYAKLATFRI